MQTSSSDVTSTGESGPPPPRSAARTWAFVLLVVVLVVTAVVYVRWARVRDGALAGVDGGAAIAAGAPVLLFQNLTPTGNGRLAVAPLGDPDSTRRLADLKCDRVHFAGGKGLCLAQGSRFPPRPTAMIFGSDFRVTDEVPIAGLPSRARVSADGRYAAATSFVSGHSYGSDSFSTSTIVIDMARGTMVANLEEFTVLREGRPYTAPDVNFWGVTFAEDSNRFFATLGTQGNTYLVRGDIAAKRVVVGRENVECPSLSPDGTRIGYKKRVNQGSATPIWRFHVLDLSSGQDTPLAETRSIDDQLEWLDNGTLLYGDPESSNSVMSVSADGTGQPTRFISQAQSPTVLRTPRSDLAVTDLDPGQRVVKADLGITITAPTAAEVAGVPLEHAIAVTNYGPGPATQVIVEDRLAGPGRVTSAEGHLSQGISSYGCNTEESRARCDLVRLPVGATWTVTVTVTMTGPGSLSGRAIVTAAEPDPVSGNDRAEAQTTLP